MRFGHFSPSLVALYLAYCICGLFIRTESTNFHEAVSNYGCFLTYVIALFYVFDIGFLVYLIFRTAWYVPIVLWPTALVMNYFLYAAMSKLRLTYGLRSLALAWLGMLACPFLAYALIRATP
jgi:hypothetical protein